MDNILEALEKTVAECSGCVAVDDGSVRLTWAELLELSQRIGTAFSKRVEAGKPIVLLMEKSAAALAAMFGAVYAGCFYVMIDPEQPPQRIREMFGVLSPELVLTDLENVSLLRRAGYSRELCFLKDVIRGEMNLERLMAIRKRSSGKDLLYGIFTSGSTGVPKGIAVSHRAVIDFITHFVETFGFTKKDRIGNQAPFDFDVSVKDIYTCVMTGATLVLIPRRMFSIPTALLDYLCMKRVNTLIWAVSALTLVSAMKGLKYRIPTEVTRVMFSGEIMPVKHLRMWQEALPEAEFVNLYGPSEITCNCTYYRVRRCFQDGEELPIGRSFPGRRVFLLDGFGREIVMAGETGEICVAGESLAEGYYRNPEETKARFVYAEFGKGAPRYYRTGDLGYYDREGELYFSGRKDFQIKHMGHRIELEEIERAMEQVEGLEKSCCLLDTRKNQLTAFYFGEVTEAEIRKVLREKVPVYMIPHRFIREERMVLNKNGKLDREYFRKRLEAGEET